MPEDQQPIYPQQPFDIQPPVQQNEFTVWQINPEDINNKIEHDLRGDLYDSETDMWLTDEEGKYRKMNEKGIREVLGTINMYVNKNTYLSNLSMEEINKTCNLLGNQLAELFANNYENFQMVRDLSYMTLLVWKITNMIFFTLKSSQEEGMRKYFGGTVRNYNMPQRQEKRSFLPKFS